MLKVKSTFLFGVLRLLAPEISEEDRGDNEALQNLSYSVSSGLAPSCWTLGSFLELEPAMVPLCAVSMTAGPLLALLCLLAQRELI